jgi:MFS family permease
MTPATGLLGEVTSLFPFVMLRFLQGIAAAAIVAPALAYAGDLAQADGKGRQGREMSVVTMASGLGIAFGPLVAAILSVVLFQLPFFVVGLLCLLGAGILSNAAVYLEKDVAEFGSLCYHDWARTFEVNTMGVMRVAEYFALLDTTASHFPGNSQPRRRSFSGVHFSFGLPRG